VAGSGRAFLTSAIVQVVPTTFVTLISSRLSSIAIMKGKLVGKPVELATVSEVTLLLIAPERVVKTLFT
jgi:hypothetical protein